MNMRFSFVPFNYSREKNISWKYFLKCFKTFYKIHVLLKNFKILLVEDIKFRVKLKKQHNIQYHQLFMRFYSQFLIIFLPSIPFWSCLLKLMQHYIKLIYHLKMVVNKDKNKGKGNENASNNDNINIMKNNID